MPALLLVLAATLFPPPDTEVALRGGESHEYVRSLARGEFEQLVVEQLGVDVVVTVHAPDGSKIAEVDSPNGANGPEPVPIAAAMKGDYRIEVRSFDAGAAPGKYTIRVAEHLSAADYRKRLAAERARDEAVIAWFRARALPLEDASLEQVFTGVRVAGLGEATHGSHEIFTLKNRLIRFLVTRMGFTVVALEGSVASTELLNDYVQGRASREAALPALKASGWITDTQELAELVEWLRGHNASVAPERRVRLIGLDPQGSTAAIDFLAGYLERVERPGFRPTLDAVRVQDANAIAFAPTEISADVLRELHRLVAFLSLHEGTLVQRTSADEYRRALDSARLLAQFGEFNASLPPGQGGTRDGFMADHLLRALSAAPEARAIVWAHNSHIAARQEGSFPPMGGTLRKVFGAGYYALATAFDRGTFQAQLARSSPPEVREFSLPAAAMGTVDWFLTRATDGDALVDLRRDPPSDARIAEWLRTPHRMHWVGAIFSDASSPWQPFVLSRDFDAIAFIESTTRARPR